MRRATRILLLLALLPCSSAFGQSLLQEVKTSSWDTRYEAANGARVRAILRFSGGSGSYRVLNSSNNTSATGSLSNVKYFPVANSKVLINGNWSLQGSRGAFQFEVTRDGQAIHGAWDSVQLGTGGKWSGSRLQGGGGGNVGGGNGGGGNGDVSYTSWKYNPEKNYYYSKCKFPAGGYQYVIYKKSKPYWVYWYNPQKKVYWCACPTKYHPTWGDEIRRGEDLFLMASVKSSSIEGCTFPSVGTNKSKFKAGKATDDDGSTVDLGCPPSDLP